MSYANEENVVEAFNTLTTYGIKMNTFLGFVCLWINSEKINEKYITASMHNFSTMVDKAFYLSTEKSSRQTNKEKWFVLFQDQWIDELSKQLLKGQKIDLLSVALAFFWQDSFSNTQELISKFKSYFSKEMLDIFFDYNDREINFENMSVLMPDKLKQALINSGFKPSNESFTVSFDAKDFLRKAAGDLTAAPFGQTLYSNNWLKEVFICTNFDFLQLYSLSLTNINNQIKNLANQIGENIIFYGAPGTGKSYEIDQLTNSLNSIRTVFHPDTQYSDFVGCLKPSMKGTNIQYSFKAGPFTEAIIQAARSVDNHHFLVIEELNRASAAAVFGDIFQLLDRNEKGESIYSINISDPDLLDYFKGQIEGFIEDGKLKIPANLSIYATMNSSDQAVMPLDTAFKRRWQFKYKKLDFNHCAQGFIEVVMAEQPVQIKWKEFAQAINLILSENNIQEDRHIGPWFLGTSELSDKTRTDKTLTGKLFMYLWDDVLRHGRSALIFNHQIKTYGGLISAYENKQIIFSERLLSLLKPQVQAEIASSEL